VTARKQKNERCAEVKTTLADKYERLAKSVKSRPRQVKYLRRAHAYRREAARKSERLPN
jgi:hypothetical protein